MLSGPQSVQIEVWRASQYRYLRSFLHQNHNSQTTPKSLHGHSIKVHPGLLCTALQRISPTVGISRAGLVFTWGSRVGNCSVKGPEVRNRELQTSCSIFYGQELIWVRSRCITESDRQEGSLRKQLKTQKGTAALNCRGEQLVIIYSRSGQRLKA